MYFVLQGRKWAFYLLMGICSLLAVLLIAMVLVLASKLSIILVVGSLIMVGLCTIIPIYMATNKDLNRYLSFKRQSYSQQLHIIAIGWSLCIHNMCEIWNCFLSEVMNGEGRKTYYINSLHHSFPLQISTYNQLILLRIYSRLLRIVMVLGCSVPNLYSDYSFPSLLGIRGL